jgi:hypothetical protein
VTDPIVADLRRELEKARAALIAAQAHLAAHAEMNAALHCADRVVYSPLHARVTNAVLGIDQALERTDRPNVPTLDPTSSDGPWAALVADLDRCRHGRHQGDDCADCGGRSIGNTRFEPGQPIAFDRYGRDIVVPDRDRKHDPSAWRREAHRG